MASIRADRIRAGMEFVIFTADGPRAYWTEAAQPATRPNYVSLTLWNLPRTKGPTPMTLKANRRVQPIEPS